MIKHVKHAASLLAFLLFLFPLVSPPPVSAQEMRSVGYSIAPRATYIRWDDALGLQNNWMWGASFNFDLGQRVRLSPFFLTRSGLNADPTTLGDTPTPFPGAEPFDFDARHLGVDLDVDLTEGNVVPFVRLGGGVLRVSPVDTENLDRITLTYGGGLRLGLDRAALEVSAANTMFRLSPERLYSPTTEIEGTEDSHNNLMLGTRVTLPLSDQPDQRNTGVLGATGAFDLYGGQLNLDLPQTNEDQRFVGLRAGAAFNDLLTLSGFYWKGVNNNFDATEDMQSYGAEARFDLGTGSGLSPFLVAGGGRVDFADDAPDTASVPGDQTALILGAGVGFRITDRVDLQVSARDYLMDPSASIGDVADPSSLRSSWEYSGGVSIQLGGSSANARQQRPTEAEWADYMESQNRQYQEYLRQSSNSAMRDSMRNADRDMAGMTDMERMARMHQRMESMRAMQEGRSTEGTTYRAPDGRTFTLPVLEEGTVYIRFGDGGVLSTPTESGEGTTVTPDEIRRIIRAEINNNDRNGNAPTSSGRAGAQQPQRPTTAQRGNLSTPTIEQRLDQIERQLSEIMYNLDEGSRYEPQGAAARQPSAQPGVNVRTGTEAGERAYVAFQPSIEVRTDRAPVEQGSIPTGQTAFDRLSRWDTWDTRTYGGVNFDDRTQAVLGARFDFGPLNAGSRLRLTPEVAVGFGESDPTLLVMGNVQYTLARFGGERNFAPYLVGGVGFFSPTLLGVNTGIGVSADVLVNEDNPVRAFAEWDGLNLFDRNRMLFGISLTR